MDIQKTRYKKLFTHVESHASAVSLLESGEQRCIKAINNTNNSSAQDVHALGTENLASESGSSIFDHSMEQVHAAAMQRICWLFSEFLTCAVTPAVATRSRCGIKT